LVLTTLRLWIFQRPLSYRSILMSILKYPKQRWNQIPQLLQGILIFPLWLSKLGVFHVLTNRHYFRPLWSLVAITAPLSQSATCPPFTYKILGFDPNVVLFHSTQPTLSLGAGSSNTPLQGSTRGIPSPYNYFPYGGGHIPPVFPTLGSAHQQSVGPSMNYGSYGVDSQGLPSNSQSVGSTPFSLFSAFSNNAFSSVAFPTRGNSSYGQLNPMQGTIPT
jgi:hypothetical protein